MPAMKVLRCRLHRCVDLLPEYPATAAAAEMPVLAGGQVKQLPSLGSTPMGDTVTANHNSLMAWLKSIPLANCAARSKESHGMRAARQLELP